MGGSVAAHLARNGVDSLVLDANRDHVLRLRNPGLAVDGLGAGERTKLAAYTASEAGGELDRAPDVVLLAVRSQATGEAVRFLLPYLAQTTDVVSLQNGINEDTIADIVGAERTIGCVVGFGATWIEPGRISLDATGDLEIGRLDGSDDERLAETQQLLQLAFPTKTTTNIRGVLWAKMLVNSMTVLGALGGCLTGELLLTRERRRVVADVVAEGVNVALAEGIELPSVFGLVPPALVRDDDRWHEVMDRVLIRVGEAFGAIKSVTWRDLELGRPTEIDAVTGEIVRRAQRHGVLAPLSTAVYSMLREIETGTRTSSAANVDELQRSRSGVSPA